MREAARPLESRASAGEAGRVEQVRTGGCTGAHHETCPFLIPVVGDQLWVHTVPAYCRRPNARLRVPATFSLLHFCAGDYAACDGYQLAAALVQDDLGD